MIKNFTIAILVALFAYLLSAQDQLIGDYAIYVAIASAALVWFTSFLSGKDSEKSHSSLVELLESLNQLIDVQNQNTSETVSKVDHLCEIEKECTATLGNQITALKDTQEKNSENTISKVNGVINCMKDAICKELRQSGEKTDSLIKNSFKNNTDRAESYSLKQLAKLESLNKLIDVQNQRASETIGTVDRLCEIEKDGISSLGIQLSALKATQEENTSNTISTVNEVINGMKEAICEELRQSGERIDAIIRDSFNNNIDHAESISQKQLAKLDFLNELIDVQNQKATETISKVGLLCEIEKENITTLGDDISALRESQKENTGNTISMVNEVVNGMKEAICEELRQSGEKTDTIIRDSLKNNTDRVESFFEKQSALSDQIQNYYNKFNTSVNSFSKTIEQYENLSETVQEEISNVSTRAELLTNTTLENYKSTTDNMLTTIESVKQYLSTAIDKMTKSMYNSIESNQLTTEKIANNIQEKLKSSLDEFAETTKGQQDAANEAINKVCELMAKEQGSKLQKLNDGISDINLSIKDFNRETEYFNESINETLKTIKDQLESSYEEINDSNREQLETSLFKIQEKINTALKFLSDDLTDFATTVTNYDKEKEIIQSLEKLCGK